MAPKGPTRCLTTTGSVGRGAIAAMTCVSGESSRNPPMLLIRVPEKFRSLTSG